MNTHWNKLLDNFEQMLPLYCVYIDTLVDSNLQPHNTMFAGREGI